VLARPQGLHADALSLQVSDAADAFIPKQFEAADVHPRNHRYWRTAVDTNGEGCCIRHGEFGVAACDCGDRGSARRDRTHIADIGEPLGLQQLLGDVLGRIADPGDLYKAHRCGFKRSLCGARCRRAGEARGSSHDRVVRNCRRDCVNGIGSPPSNALPATRA
jgi:hypothetical protein